MNILNRRSLNLFNKLAHFYDLIIFSWFFKIFYVKIEKSLGDIGGKKILSIGCGTGTLEIWLAKKFSDAQIIGLDLSPMMVEKANKKIQSLNNIKFIEGNSEKLPFKNNVFDVIICSHSFHHYPNQKTALQEIKRTLSKTGAFILVDAIKTKLISKIWIFLIENLLEPGVKHYSPNKLKELLDKAGFTNVNIKQISLVYGLITASS